MDRYAKTVALQNYVIGLNDLSTDKVSVAVSAMLDYLLESYPAPPTDKPGVQYTARTIIDRLRSGEIGVTSESDLAQMPDWFVPVAIFYSNVNIHRLPFDYRKIEKFPDFAFGQRHHRRRAEHGGVEPVPRRAEPVPTPSGHLRRSEGLTSLPIG